MNKKTTDQLPKRKNQLPSVQRFMNILEIRDGTVILKDGTIRGIILVSSINFSLKSEEEQNAVIQAYVQFLNTLEFPIQILIQSRRLNIDDYLERMKQVEREQVNELLKMQTREYRQYISELVQLSDIMSKKFYIVIPYTSGKITGKGFVSILKESLSPTNVIHIKEKKFQKNRIDLIRRMEFIMDGLASMGLKSVALDTQGLIELLYNTYNPDTYDQQKLVDINKLNVEMR